MKPFYDVGQFKQLPAPTTTAPTFQPSKTGYGVEIRQGRDMNKRKNSLFISSGQWAEMSSDGMIDQEVKPVNLGQLIDVLDITSFTDQVERKTAEQVLVSGEIIRGQTLDFESETSTDGKITIFEIRPRGYVVNEEIPQKTRGPKVSKESIDGISTGVSYDPFLDGGASELGISREGFYGTKQSVTDIFVDMPLTSSLGYTIDTGDYDSEYETGAFGTTLYSSVFGTDSIAFAGLLR
jgi:hypothetical protein